MEISHTLSKATFVWFQVREERLKAYADKKSKKPALIAKTSVLLDVKPWGDETDLNEMLVHVKSIEKDGLVWGAGEYLISEMFLYFGKLQ